MLLRRQLAVALLTAACVAAGCGGSSGSPAGGDPSTGDGKADDPSGPVLADPVPAYPGWSEPLPDEVRAQMTGVSWRESCPVSLDELALLHLPHYDFAGEVRDGLLVVHDEVAADVISAFAQLFAAKFPIRKMVLVDEYGLDPDQGNGASDAASMADDNTSAFNCRASVGTTVFSQHAYGRAVDINPIENPYVKGTTVLPEAGAEYLERDASMTGVIVRGGPVTSAFSSIGWKWGGNYRSLKDYQHFSANGL